MTLGPSYGGDTQHLSVWLTDVTKHSLRVSPVLQQVSLLRAAGGEEELEKPPLGWTVRLLVFLMGCLPMAPRVVPAGDLTPPRGQRSSHSSVSQTWILSEMHQKSLYVSSWTGLTSRTRSLWSAGYTLCRMLPGYGTLLLNVMVMQGPSPPCSRLHDASLHFASGSEILMG